MGKIHRQRKGKRKAKTSKSQHVSEAPIRQEPVRRCMNRAQRRNHLKALREAPNEERDARALHEHLRGGSIMY